MAFKPDNWADGEEGGTPVTAAELNRIEQAGAEAVSTAEGAASAASDATQAASDAAKTATWGQISNRPSSFTPSDHTHEIADVDGLQAALDALSERVDALEA
jgi:hypothetical protein